MKKINLKENKGITMADVIIGVIILTIFTAMIGNLFYQIAFHSAMIRSNAIAVYYVVQIAERIDKIAYEEVVGDLTNTLKQQFSVPDEYNITIEVENYNKDDASKQDIIKIVTITAQYECYNEQRQYQIKKLKIKEI